MSNGAALGVILGLWGLGFFCLGIIYANWQWSL
jgi:hypothetical protein